MKTALVAGIVAMLVSSASATAAFVVTSRNIKNGTIQLADISAQARHALKGSRGPRGRAGAPGLSGPQGAQGPPGKSLSYVNGYSEHTAVPPGSFRFVNAVCPANTAVVGGGYATERVAEAKLIPSNSYPIGMPDGRSAWYVVMHNTGGQEEVFWAVAYCVSGF